MKRISLGLVLAALLLGGYVIAQDAIGISTATCPGQGCAALLLAGQGAVGVQITNTFSGTISFEQTIDGNTWSAWTVVPSVGGVGVTSATAAGQWVGSTLGDRQVRARFSSYVSGNALVSFALSTGSSVNSTTTNTFTNLQTFSGGSQTNDGTALLPAYSFTSEPTLGFWRSGAGTITAQGTLVASGAFSTGGNVILGGAGGALTFSAGGRITSATNGFFDLQTQNAAIGSLAKVDALPTISSGTGTGVAVIAGSTPLAGAVNVGTVSPGTIIVVNFNGTAYPSAPHCLADDENTILGVRAQASTTQLTLTSAGFTASDIVDWICISSK
jgi:hypothetical protein